MAAITHDQINDEIQAAVTAYKAGEYSTALTHCEAAQMLIAAIPRMVVGSGSARNELEYSNQIEKIVKQIRDKQRAASSAGALFYSTPIVRGSN